MANNLMLREDISQQFKTMLNPSAVAPNHNSSTGGFKSSDFGGVDRQYDSEKGGGDHFKNNGSYFSQFGSSMQGGSMVVQQQ